MNTQTLARMATSTLFQRSNHQYPQIAKDETEREDSILGILIPKQ
jgi:hypothetical protein